MSISEIQKQTEYKMNRTVETLREDFIKIRTGRASTGLLDHVMVDYYGTMTPINQVAQVGVADARTLTVQPWEKSMVAPVEKAIRTSDLGLNPATSGMLIRVPLPPLTAAANSPKLFVTLVKKLKWLCVICVVTQMNRLKNSLRLKKFLRMMNPEPKKTFRN